MKQDIQSAQLIKFLFLLATFSLVATGQLIGRETTMAHLLATQYYALVGTWLLYGFDWRRPFKKGAQRIFIAQGLCIGIFAFTFVSAFQWVVIGFIAFLSIIYQVRIPLVKLRFEFKKRLLFKNVLIGLSWAALIPLGAGQLDKAEIQFLFWFMAVQVGYGSVIRDITDIAHDKKRQLQTLPIYFGVPKTILILQLLNVSSFFLAYYYVTATGLNWQYYLAVIVICYKSTLLYMVKKGPSTKLWTQYLNISTCMLIFVLTYFLA